MSAHEDALKGQAKRLRSALAEEDVVLGHRKTLDLIARLHGWRNWHVLHAALEQGQSVAAGLTQSPLPNMTKEQIQMTLSTDGSIPTFLKTRLSVPGPASILDMFNALPDTIGQWKRDHALEARAEGTGNPSIYYVRQDNQEPMVAFAVASDGQSASVVNIVPKLVGDTIFLEDANQLEHELVEALRLLLPAQVSVKQNAKSRHLRDLVTPETYTLFKNHSANKSTGNSHPNDRARWLKFVAQAASEGLDDRDEHRTLVRQALIGEGFSERGAEQISQDYALQIEAILSVL